MEVPLFKCRASQLGKICGKTGLGKTGETLVDDYLKFYSHGFKREFTSKYTEKGNICEEQGIELVQRVYGHDFLAKNTERKENAFISGECDIATKLTIEDIKNSWDAGTFPFYQKANKNDDYEWQAQGYLWLWGKEQYALHYTLNDAPQKMIDAEYWKQHRFNNIDGEEVNEELYEYIKSKMIYSHLPDKLRIKTFYFKRDEAKIQFIIKRVTECRELIKSFNINQ